MLLRGHQRGQFSLLWIFVDSFSLPLKLALRKDFSGKGWEGRKNKKSLKVVPTRIELVSKV
jgi:hypothetical protein